MNFARIRNVKAPNRANPDDVGYDFYLPEFDDEFIEELIKVNKELMGELHEHFSFDGRLRLKPFQRIRIPSGICIDVPKNHAFIAENKTGVSYKKGLITLARLVDPGFQAELTLGVQNTTDENLFLSPGEKLIQFVLHRVELPDLVECHIETLFPKSSARGSGSFGSTGV